MKLNHEVRLNDGKFTVQPGTVKPSSALRKDYGGLDCLSRKAAGEGEVKWLLKGVKFGRKALDSDIEYISFITYILVPYHPLL